jgi:hypothetical protein
MADRKRSRDGHRETQDLPGEAGAASQAGRSGGQPKRDVAAEDEFKRALERPAGATRVTGRHKDDESGGDHGKP